MKFNPENETLIAYTYKDGLQDDEFSGACCRLNTGELLFGGYSGFNIFHPNNIVTNKFPPPALISKVMVNDILRLPGAGDFTDMTLTYDENNILFEFTAADYNFPEQNQYSYFLEGYDKNWQNTDATMRTAKYTNLDPGAYAFKVSACNNDEVWNKEPAAFSFVITPPFWQTWWFYSLCVLFICSGVYAFIKIRERNLIREKRILEERVKQRTVVITKQKEELSVKNKDITDSIRYASNIQQAILPPLDDISKTLPGSFVLFKPKDIVSGDFYFFTKVNKDIILAACDSTGHGVPGAFISILGSQLLNEIVNDKSVNDAAEVLNQLRDGIIHAFGEAGTIGKQKDGMDMALCVFQYKKDGSGVNLQYAGANNPLYIVKKA